MEYKLLTPGPLTTSDSVKNAMLVDHCTWDEDYKEITQSIREELLNIAGVDTESFTVVLMQGSGSFSVESVLSSTIGKNDKVLICSNGAYGKRMAEMANRHDLNYTMYNLSEDNVPNAKEIEKILENNKSINTLAIVHSETTSGILNPLEEISEVVKKYNLSFIVDAMSSFGGIEIHMEKLNIDYLISSANKCIQGVPGFGFIICNKDALKRIDVIPRTLSLDLLSQLETMDIDGKWRYTSPTHTVLAFKQAILELQEEGGVSKRHKRYKHNNEIIRKGLEELGFEPYLKSNQGPFITSFKYPENEKFDFNEFYEYLKNNGYAIYPGKISEVDCFRIGNIGDIYPEDMYRVVELVKEYMEGIK